MPRADGHSQSRCVGCLRARKELRRCHTQAIALLCGARDKAKEGTSGGGGAGRRVQTIARLKRQLERGDRSTPLPDRDATAQLTRRGRRSAFRRAGQSGTMSLRRVRLLSATQTTHPIQQSTQCKASLTDDLSGHKIAGGLDAVQAGLRQSRRRRPANDTEDGERISA